MRVHYCNEPWAPLSGWWPLASQATMGWGRAAAWPGPLSLSLFSTNSHAVPRRGPCGCGETLLPPALSFVPWGAAGFPRFPEHRLSPGVPQPCGSPPFPSLAPASAGSGHPHSRSPHVGRTVALLGAWPAYLEPSLLCPWPGARHVARGVPASHPSLATAWARLPRIDLLVPLRRRQLLLALKSCPWFKIALPNYRAG